MKMEELHKRTVEELVERFVEIGLAQDEALLDDEVAEFNRLFDQMRAVVQELKARPDDQRSALLVLYEHSNMQVRIKAAKNSLAVAPQAARNVLQEIAESHHYPQAMEAGMSLWNLDRGIFKPS